MKNVQFILMRHGKNVVELGSTLPESEIKRAHEAGIGLYEVSTSIDLVCSSALPRAIQTAFSTVNAHSEHSGNHPRLLLAAEQCFGNNELFNLITAPEGYRDRSKKVGFLKAALEVHGEDKMASWVEPMMAAMTRINGRARDGETALLVIHSPSVEMVLWAISGHTLEHLPPEMSVMKELDAVVVTSMSSGASIQFKIEKKIEAPPIEPPKEVVELETGGLDAEPK